LVVNYNIILGFMGFVVNDIHGYVTIFWFHLFRIVPTIKPIKKACCKSVKANELMNPSIIVEVFGHVDVS
jgi:hypothetical protein